MYFILYKCVTLALQMYVKFNITVMFYDKSLNTWNMVQRNE